MLKVFNDSEFKKKFLGLFFPALVQELLLSLITVIGTIIVGIYNQDSLTGVTLGNNIFLLFNLTLIGIVVTGSVFASQFLGKNDHDSINKIFNIALKLGIIISIIFMVISLIIPDKLIWIFAPNNEEVIKRGAIYLRIFSISFPLRAISAIYFYNVKVLGKSKIIIFTSIVTITINLLLTSLLIFVANLDTLGAAIAMVVSRFIELGMIIIYSRKFPESKFSISRFFKSDKSLTIEFLKYCLPICGSRFIWAIAALMISVIIGRIPDSNVLSANSYVSIAKNLIITSTIASSSTTAILIGQDLGAESYDLAKSHSLDIMKLDLILGIINMTVFLLSCPIILLIGTNSMSVECHNYTYKMFLIYAISFIPQAFNGSINDGILPAGGDKIFVLLNNILLTWVIVVPLSFASLYLNWPYLLTFFIVCSEEIVKFPLIIWRYKKYKWIKKIV